MDIIYKIKKLETKRKILLIAMFLYFIIGLSSLFCSLAIPSYRFYFLCIYVVFTAFYVFQYLYVSFSDIKEFENKLFNKKN